MERRRLGKTGLEVTALGFGGGQVGLHKLSEADSERLLRGALDLGINVVDTAAVYGDSEEKIGRYLADRRGDFVVITKCGQRLAETEPVAWSPAMIRFSLERSLRRMRTDHVDVFLLHSCGEEELQNDAMLTALCRCRSEGLTRFIGYSGDDAPLRRALALGIFDCVEVSMQLFDQQAIDRALPATKAADLGVIGKKGMANACWKLAGQPDAENMIFVGPYIRRLKTMGLTPQAVGFAGDWDELAVRFAAHQDGVHVALVGGTNLEHVRRNVTLVEKGPLPAAVIHAIRSLWTTHDDGSWVGLP
jgi:aryl-alcohol dehydrogenase-like predicted oxidoreductase